MHWFAVLVSLLGFFLFFRWLKRDLHPSFYPALTVFSICTLSCLGGILRILPVVSTVLFYLGCASFVGFGALHLKQDLKHPDSRTFEFLWMAGSFCVLYLIFFFVLRDRFLYSYDDYSHWGISAKILVTKSRFPVEEDRLLFPSYPLGCASWIYYCCRGLGADMGGFLFAQSVMLFSFLLSMQSAAEKHRRALLPLTLLIPLFMLHNIPLDTLAVDNLLGAAFLACALYLFREIVAAQTPERAQSRLPWLGLMLTGLTTLKNSGLFLAGILALFAVLYVLSMLRTRRISFSPRLLVLLFLGLPVVMYFLWQIHVRTSFTSLGKHYMSMLLYYATLRNSLESIGLVFSIILPHVLSPLKNHALLLIPAFACVYFASSADARKKQKPWILFSLLSFLLYEIGVLGMYIVSMTPGELAVQNGADYERYNGTMCCALAGIWVCMTVRTLVEGGLRRERPLRILPAACLLIALAFAGTAFALDVRPPDPLEVRRKRSPDAFMYSTLTQETPLPDGTDAVFLTHEPLSLDYLSFLTEYHLGHLRIRHFTDLEEARAACEENPGTVFVNLVDGTMQ